MSRSESYIFWYKNTFCYSSKILNGTGCLHFFPRSAHDGGCCHGNQYFLRTARNEKYGVGQAAPLAKQARSPLLVILPRWFYRPWRYGRVNTESILRRTLLLINMPYKSWKYAFLPIALGLKYTGYGGKLAVSWPPPDRPTIIINRVLVNYKRVSTSTFLCAICGNSSSCNRCWLVGSVREVLFVPLSNPPAAVWNR